MKKIFSLVVAIGLMSYGYSCDNCNIYLSINPNDYQHSFGIQLRSRLHFGKFDSQGYLSLKHGGAGEEFYNADVSEKYQRLEFTGNYFFNPKWNLEAVLPVVNNLQFENERTNYQLTGVGDPILIQHYQLFSSKEQIDSTKNRFSHRLRIGMGVKLPFGRIDIEQPYGKPNVDLQPGSGSLDGILATSYMFRFGNVGVSTQTNFKINTANSDVYRYGNSLNFQFNSFYQFESKHLVMVPAIGVYAEIAGLDQMAKVKMADTGGNLWFFDASLSIFIDRIRIQMNYQPLLHSKLNNEKQLITLNKWALGLYYNI